MGSGKYVSRDGMAILIAVIAALVAIGWAFLAAAEPFLPKEQASADLFSIGENTLRVFFKIQ